MISTGNEIGLDTDFVEYLADDPAAGVLVLYAEEVRRPRDFLAAIRRCRAASRSILMFPGRGAKSRQAAQSHTGSLVGDYATMRTLVEDAGAIVVSTMDEMMDLAEIMVRYPKPPVKGPGILTASGAFVALSNDFAEDLGLDFPSLDPRPCASSRRCCRRSATTAIRSMSPPASRRRRWWPPGRCWTIPTPACCSSRFRSTLR